MVDISRRQWDVVNERLSKIEGKLRSIEVKMELIEKRIKPAEVYRMVKQQEQEESSASIKMP
ncbi:MAG: hypothetical protein LWY06_14625 [Firmicutes bacterium]|nr:hypothetical protein [Bacillota bacterium]